MATPRVADPGDHVYAQIITYRGVINTGDPWDVTGGGVKAAASNTVTVTGVTTTVPDTLIVQAVARDNDSAAAAFSAETNANLTGITERSDAGTTSGNGGGFAVWDGVKATAGATGNTTASVTSSINAFLTIALKPQPPAVTSINLASANPTSTGTAVSWTVVFSASVTGVDATDFALVQAGGVSGASITSVTGVGTTWTVTANTGSGTGTLGLNLVDDDSIVSAGGTPLGGAGAGNGDFTGQVYTVSPPFCSPPSNIPAGVTVTCQCDTFGRASLNPSTIFGGNWAVSTSVSGGFVPTIDPTYTNLLQLTQASANNATAATVPGIFPAAGNYISVEFQDYAYNGTGADGIAVTLSDYSVPAVPGAFGGSLGYAQKTGTACPAAQTPCNGFAGGWIGVALDEFGNYQNPTEGRIGGPGSVPESVGVRGSGSGTSGYNYLAGTAGLTPIIDNRASTTPAPGYFYQVIVDARNDPVSTAITVNRDTSGTGTTYTPLITIPNVYAAATAQGFTQNPVPANWQISFTGSTGGSDNIHEIGGLRICAQTAVPPTGGTASGFSTIDEAYPGAPTVPAYQNFQTGHIYMKLIGTSFKLWVAALTSNGISTAYSTVSAKYASVKLVDNSDNLCGPDSARTCNSSCTNKAAVEASATQIATFPSGSNTGVASPSPTFTLNSSWKNLIAVIKECTTSACTAFTATAPACSADSFSVRPTGIVSVTSSPPIVAAGNPFSLTATVTGVGYSGVPKINSASVQAVSPATVTGTLAGTFAAATSGAGNSTATGSAFTYSEVGIFHLRGPDFTVPRIPGVYDDNWTAIDSVASKNDCNSGATAAAYSNTKDANGKYGCNFGITADTDTSPNPPFGRFIPAYFDITAVTPGCGTFTYAGLMPVGLQPSIAGQPFSVTATARNAGGQTTLNYDKTTGFAKDTTFSDAGNSTNFTNYVLPSATGFIQGIGIDSTITYRFAAKESPSQTLTLRALDTDNVSSAGHAELTTVVRSGRVHIINAYGSELANLPVPLRAEYYQDATTGWITNADDGCTSVALGSLTPSNPITVVGSSPSKTTNASIVYTPVVAGDAGLSLSAPGAGGTGYVDLSANLSTNAWLRYDWNGIGTAVDPTGRANFGLYRGSPKSIYLRERY